ASETPFFVGRAVAAVAANRRAILKTGSLLTSGQVAEEYDFNDIDGSRPNLATGVWESLMDEGWRKVVVRVRSEFKKHGLDHATVLEEDRQNLTLRARLSIEPPLWLKEVVGPPGVAFGNPDKIAMAFYKRFEELR